MLLRTPLRLAAVLAGFALLALAISACGSADPTSARTARTADFLAFAKCMRSSGVPSFPDPGGTQGGLRIQAFRAAGSTPQTLTVNGTPVSAPAFRSAMQKCRSKLPHGGVPTSQQIARIRARALTMARCMRSHDVPNFPDPRVGTGPGGGPGIRLGFGASGIDPNSPAFQNAAKVCMKNGGFFKFRGGPPPGGGG